MPKTNHRRGYRENLGHRRCSCFMCGNPRRHGWSRADRLTLQERRVELALQPERTWPGKKRSRRRYTIETRGVRWSRTTRSWEFTPWRRYPRSYRTPEGRDQAIRAFSRGGWYRNDEFRPGPDKICKQQ